MMSFKAFNYHSPASPNTLLAPLRALCFSLYGSCDQPIWLSHFYRRYSSTNLHTFMEVFKAVSKHGCSANSRAAIISDKNSYSYREIMLSARKISDLLGAVNLKSKFDRTVMKETGSLDGPRIGIVAKPSAEFVAGVLGIWLSGGVAVPLALSYPEAELLHVMTDSDISMVLSTEDHHELMQIVATKSSAQYDLIPSVPSNGLQVVAGDSTTLPEFDIPSKVEEEAAALVLYTSGTTGKPKGVVHTHRSILAQVQMLKEAWEYTASDQFLHCLPLHHVHGLFNALFAPLFAGSTVQFIPKFSVSGIWQKWRESYPMDGPKSENAITVFTGVPTMYTRLIQGYENMDPELQSQSASAARQLRLMMCGSSALPYPVMQQWESITGHRLLERYGMTEFVMALSNPLHGSRKGGTVGKPLPGVEVKIRADDANMIEGSGVGELCVRSASIFREYWKKAEVTKASFVEGGFFRTGDAVRTDEDGYYIILGRMSADIMKVGGYKLSALEIEAALLEHPTVSECCVLGLPDKAYGEAVTAIIVPDEEVKRKRQAEVKPAMTLEELSSWAKEKLAPYKIPTQLYLWDALPRNAMGKVNKVEVKKLLAANAL